MSGIPSRSGSPSPAGLPVGEGVRRRYFARLAGIGAFLFVTMGPAVLAEDEFGSNFWMAERQRLEQRSKAPARIVQRPTHLIRRAAPVKGFARDEAAPAGQPETPVEPAMGNPAIAGTPPPADGATTPGTPPAAITADVPASDKAALTPKPPAQTFVIAVLGDSLGQMLAQGLQEAYADRPEIVILRRARENTGLVRDDYFDWVKGARDLLAAPDHIDMAVMMIGSNDRQQLRDGTQSLAPRTPQWKQIYGARVEAIAAQFQARKIPLVWVGAPIMRSERMSADMADFNDIYRDGVTRRDGGYIDIWEAFSDERGQFAGFGPDVNGQMTKLRAGDGVHFTRGGARKLAHFVEGEINRRLDSRAPRSDPAIAALAPQLAPADPPQLPVIPPLDGAIAVAPPPAPAAPVIDELQALLPPPVAPEQVVIPVRPAAGPVLALTTPVLSPGGQLASRSRIASSGGIAQAVLDGRALEARPGRADDFRWPRN